VYCDYHTALHISRNLIFHSRAKHICIQYHFVWEVIEEGSVNMLKIHTKDILTDVMTKPVNTNKFEWYRFSYNQLDT